MKNEALWIFMRHLEKEALRVGEPEDRYDHAACVRIWNEQDSQISITLAARATGRELCGSLRTYLLELGADIRALYVSPYTRTQQTAALIQDCVPGVQLHLDDRLVELNPGVRWLGTFEEICAQFPEYGFAAHDDFLSAVPPHGESHAEIRDGRICDFLDTLRERKEDCIAVTHAGVIEAVRQIVYGTPDAQVVERLAMGSSVRFGSLLVCRHDFISDTLEPIAEDVILYEPSP